MNMKILLYGVYPLDIQPNLEDYFQDIKSHFLTSNDFETQINRFFKNHDLKKLPNYFFRLQQKKK